MYSLGLAPVMDSISEAMSYGLVLTAVEMGDAITEAGAISAVSAFFRRNLDACAWAEEATTTEPPFSTSAAGAPPPPLRFPIRTHGAGSAYGADSVHGAGSGSGSGSGRGGGGDGGGGGGATIPASSRTLELVVSRGLPGPEFSQHETCLAENAALLLQQTLARIRDRCTFAETEAALESSLRGMEEASEAVARMVGERERRAQREAQQRTYVREEHEKALLAAREDVERAQGEGRELRRRLVNAEESIAVVADAANDLCRAAAAASREAAGDAGSEKAGVGWDAETGELVAVIERAAQKALRCSAARVERAEEAAVPVTDGGGGGGGVVASAAPGRRGGFFEAGRRDTNKEAFADARRDEERCPDVLRVPVPQCDRAAPLVLFLRNSSEATAQRFGKGDEALASTLAACLGTAMSALCEKKHRRQFSRHLEDERKARVERDEAAAASTAAAAHEAQERVERAVAGMRALVAATRASKSQAEAEAAKVRRATQQTDALRYLLSGLTAAGHDHPAVAKVVAERSAPAVPMCAGAVLLTPRRERREKERHAAAAHGRDGAFLFSPDPRAWAIAASENIEGREAAGADVPKGKHRRRWARAIERAAARAAATGETVHVRDSDVDDGIDINKDANRGSAAGPASCRVVCFSPVFADSVVSASVSEVQTGVLGDSRRSSRVSKVSDRMSGDGATVYRTAGLGGADSVMTPCCDSAVCVVAWMLYLTGGACEGEGSLRSKTDSQTLPPWVSSAMEGVVHAVGLALSKADRPAVDDDGGGVNVSAAGGPSEEGASAAAAAAPAASSTGGAVYLPKKRLSILTRKGDGDVENASRRESDQRSDRRSRDEELEVLREGTSALAGRVQALERKAAGLRASEARSSAALARARVDAMAVKGDLQLTALERDRLLMRLKDAEAATVAAAAATETERSRRGRQPLTARADGNIYEELKTAAAEGEAGRGEGGFLSFLGPPKGGSGGREVETSRQDKLFGSVGGVKEASTREGISVARTAERGSRDFGLGATSGEGEARRETRRSSARLGALSVCSVADASSEALQRMASVHARLSDSLKRSAFLGERS